MSLFLARKTKSYTFVSQEYSEEHRKN